MKSLLNVIHGPAPSELARKRKDYMYMYIMLLFQCFKIIFDQHNGIKLKHNGVNVKHNR